MIDDLGFPRFEKVLQQFPDLIFIGHSAGFWSEISGDVTLEERNEYPAGPVASGGRVPELLRQYPNLYADISARSGFNALTRDPEHAYTFIAENQDRLVLGLDYCSADSDMTHIEWLSEIRNQSHITDEAYEKIMWKNINRILNLGLGTNPE